jgi:hypothetical protein
VIGGSCGASGVFCLCGVQYRVCVIGGSCGASVCFVCVVYSTECV